MTNRQFSLNRWKSIINFGKCIWFLPALVISCTPEFRRFDETRVFRYNEAAGISSLDPAFAREQANIWAVHQLFNGLVQLSDRLQVLPCIARSWEISDDGMRYKFHLRQDVKFHDDPCFPGGEGRVVVASDFVYSFNRIKESGLASAGAWVFDNTDKLQPFLAPDDSTFVVNLARPFPPFLGILSMPYGSVVPREAVNYYGDSYREHPVGTGPFSFGYWKEGVKLVLIRNQDYFEWEEGKRLPFLDAVSITFLADKQAAFLQFVQGKLDFISGLDPSYKDELLTRDGQMNPKYKECFYLLAESYLNTEYLGFLVDTSITKKKVTPLQSRLVRKAINYSFDRKKMILYLRNNIGTPGFYGIIPPGMPGFDTSQIYYTYQPEVSKRLLREAGFGEGVDIPKLTLYSTPDYLDICKYIQNQVAELGIPLDIEISPPAAVREMKAMAKLPFFRASWIADYPDAENYLSLFYSPNFSPRGPNYTHYSNSNFDELFREAMMVYRDSARFKIYQRMEELMMDDAPVVVLYYDKVLRFVRNNVYNLGVNPMNLLTLKRVYKN